jgi:hypothetical protein
LRGSRVIFVPPPEGHVVALGAEFAADESAVLASGLRVPAGRGGQIRGKRGGIAAVFSAAANAVGSIAHLNHGNSEPCDTEDESGASVAEIVVGARLAHPAHAVAAKQIDLLVEGQFFQDEIGTDIGGKLGIHPGLLLSKRGKGDEQESENCRCEKEAAADRQGGSHQGGSESSKVASAHHNQK